MAPQRSDKFYIQTIVFQVEDTLFRVPSDYFHNHSPIFGAASEMSSSNEVLKQEGSNDVEKASELASKSSKEPQSEGSCDENPILLPLPNGATKQDFEHFLKLIFPLSMFCPIPTNLSREAWLSVLKLATFWHFLDLRNIAIGDLSKKHKMTAIEQVQFGREFRVEPWLRKGFRGLTQSNLPTFDELQALGFETVAKLLYIRCAGNHDVLIQEMFENEFRDTWN